MKNKKEQISATLLMFSVGCFIQGSTLLIGFVTTTTKHETWIIVITGFIVAFPIIYMYSYLASKFPGKSIMEINDIVYGKIIGKIFSLLYLFFFFSISFLNANDMGDFVVGSILPETPKIAVLILFLSLCAYTVRKGIEPLTRCSILFIIILIAVLIFNSTLLVKNMRLSNFLPIFALPIKSYIQGTQVEAFIPFCEIIIFFMLFPNVRDPQNIKKPLIGGLLIGAGTMLIVVLRDTAVLGPVISMVSSPAFDAVRLINIANTLTRMEMFYVTILTMLLFFKVSIAFYATVIGISQIFKLNSYKILVPVVGVLIAIFALIGFKSSLENAYWGSNIAPFYSMFFEFLLPVITVIVAAVRGFLKNKEVKLT